METIVSAYDIMYLAFISSSLDLRDAHMDDWLTTYWEEYKVRHLAMSWHL